MISEVNSAGAFLGGLGVDAAVRIVRHYLIFSRLFPDVVGTTGLRIEDSLRFLSTICRSQKALRRRFQSVISVLAIPIVQSGANAPR